MQDITIHTRNTTIKPDFKKKIQKKIEKHSNLLEQATSIEVIITKIKSQGNLKFYEFKISVKLPRAFIKVKESGKNLNDLLDQVENILFRRLKRYHDLKRKWEGTESWKEVIKNDYYLDIDSETFDDYSDFEPIITKRKTYEDDTPRHPAEAIELMELLGRTAFLFKNIETGKHSMVYKQKDGSYALIEPPSLD